MKQMKKRLFSLLLAAALLLTLAGCAASGAADKKTVTVTVVHGDGTQREFTLQTAAETLSGALEEAALAQGEEGPYGLYILTVDGETRFACVDGPDFDGHKVDWDLAVKRNQMYREFEMKKHEEVCNLYKQEVK